MSALPPKADIRVQRPRLVALSTVTEPPILMQPPVPGILTNPAPYSLHDFTFALARGLAAYGGREGASWEPGSVSVWAPAPSPIVTVKVTAAAIMAAQRSVKRYRMAFAPYYFFRKPKKPQSLSPSAFDPKHVR
jgi:hypothetical protein